MQQRPKPEVDSPPLPDPVPSVVSPLVGEQRLHARYAVDEEASLLLLDRARSYRCRILDLSLKGCRLRTGESYSAGARLRAEVAFSVNGVAFRFLGVVRWADGGHLLGIQFQDSLARRQQQLAEVIAEMQAAVEAREAAAQLQARQKTESSVAPAIAPPVVAPPLIEPQPKRDRRASVRYPVDTSAKIYFVKMGAVLCGRIVDLSLGGCRIHCGEPFPVGIFTRIEVEFVFSGLPFRLGGVIQALHDRQTVGIRFLDMSARKRGQLQHLIYEIERIEAIGRASETPQE
jgi:hypothetical protein